MIPRVAQFINIMKQIERNIYNRVFGGPPKEFSIVYVGDSNQTPIRSKMSIKDIIGDGILFAVPKFRRTVEKRLKRKFGSPDYVWKMLEVKTNLKVCRDCGHHYESGRLCGNCYSKVKEETEEIKQKIQEKLGTGPIEKDVIVLYEGDSTPEQPPEFWKGKRIIEMQKERPQWFSKNLLQKTTQKPSDSTDVKPTDLA
ncbi:large ribosomal subunit protein bL32m [Amyelois transitella]|uniref:large ribosomal subunit protein bL32m n=1 Tax=Amyelois transitella TaxID=680683 RepID=UPI00067DD3DC|nr:large ribosomal subunit protein bL32m [Amyelois transitella]